MKNSILYLPQGYRGSAVIMKNHLNNSSGAIVLKTSPEFIEETSLDVSVGVESLFEDWRSFTSTGPTFILFTKDAPINYRTTTRAKNGRFASTTFLSTLDNFTIDEAFMPYITNASSYVFSKEYREMMERVHKENGGSSIFIYQDQIRIFGTDNGTTLPSGAWRSNKLKSIKIPIDWYFVKKPKVQYFSKWDFSPDLGYMVYDNGRRKRATTAYNAFYQSPNNDKFFDYEEIAWSKLMNMVSKVSDTAIVNTLVINDFTKVLG